MVVVVPLMVFTFLSFLPLASYTKVEVPPDGKVTTFGKFNTL